MPAIKIADKEFIRFFETLGPQKFSEQFKMNRGAIYKRRRAIELKHNIVIVPRTNTGAMVFREVRDTQYTAPGRLAYNIPNGVALIGSDLHIWPGPKTTIFRAFLQKCKELEPKIVILNGDVVDMAAVSRHPPIGWERQPTVQEEIEAAQERLHEIEMATKRIPLVWTLGNHDSRFATRLATVAPEYAKVNGVHLQDHFPNWEPCWSCWINDDVVVKHRFKGGIHAPWNNTMNSGKTIITGHLHSAKVTPLTDYNGTRYGVDTGCMADPEGRQFLDYTEDNPKNWRSAFGVLTFKNSKLLYPELVIKWDEDHVQFRGELIKVK